MQHTHIRAVYLGVPLLSVCTIYLAYSCSAATSRRQQANNSRTLDQHRVPCYCLYSLCKCVCGCFVVQQGAGSWTGGCSAQSLQQRVEELEAAVLAAVQEALPAETGEQGASMRFRQQHYHKREDAFKLELANFVAEFATSGPSRV